MGELDRYIGLEMALDGCLVALSSSVDAAVGSLVDALESMRQRQSVPIPRRLLKALWKKDWGVAKRLAKLDPAFGLLVAPSIDVALHRDDEKKAIGDLARIRDLRNQMVHSDTLARAFYRGAPAVTGQTCLIRPPWDQSQEVDAITLLGDARGLCAHLVAAVFEDVERCEAVQGDA